MDLKLQFKYLVGKHLRYESHFDFLNKCYKDSVIIKGFQWKWTVQLDATAEEEKRCMKVREDAALKLIDLSRMFCSMKCNDLQLEIQASPGKVCYEDRSEVQRWAIAEKDSISCLKAKKFFILRESNRSLSSHTQSNY